MVEKGARPETAPARGRIKCSYSVTFESRSGPPLTFKGEAEGTGARPIIARAVAAAYKQKQPGVRWSSIVALIERIDDDD